MIMATDQRPYFWLGRIADATDEAIDEYWRLARAASASFRSIERMGGRPQDGQHSQVWTTP